MSAEARYHAKHQASDEEYRLKKSAASRAWYQANKEKAVAAATIRVRNRRARIKAEKEAAMTESLFAPDA